MYTGKVAEPKGLLNGLKWKIKGLRYSIPHALRDEKSFLLELLRERVRAERYGTEYVILQLSAKPGGDMYSLYVLCQAAAARCRTSDTVGFHGDGVGLLLPETAKEDVCGIVASIEQTFHERLRRTLGYQSELPEIECKVYYSSFDSGRHSEHKSATEAGR